jgi:RHS repeat-associated protein
MERRSEQPSGGRGNVVGYGGADSTRQKFTGKERDAESNLDYFLSRYYSSAQGRFTSPDGYLIIFEKEKGKNEKERDQILLGYISQPQVWNKYVYVLNNPLRHIDPDSRRELTLEDQIRLRILWDAYYEAKKSTDQQINSELAAAIIGAISEIVAGIDAVVEGYADPANLRAVEFAIDKLGNTDYADSGTVSNGVTRTVQPGQNKCNVFCANAYAIGGGVGFGGAGVPVNTTFFGRKYPPAANDLANSSTPIKNFEVVTTPGLGDIAAFPARIGLGHSAIYAGGGAVIYASTNNVKIQTVQYVLTTGSGHAFVTYRRYKP